MTLRRDLQLGLAALVALQLLMALGAIGLLVRMGPAMDLILANNARSIDAVSEMLAVLAAAGGPVPEAASARFDGALQAACDNITEPGEQPVLDDLRLHQVAALAGPGPARERAVADLLALARLNREVMDLAAARAQRLGQAGAWAAVLLALVTVWVAALVVRRLHRRLLVPVRELQQVLAAERRGDTFRRCAPLDAPPELHEVMAAVNGLLDRDPRSPAFASARSDVP